MKRLPLPLLVFVLAFVPYSLSAQDNNIAKGALATASSSESAKYAPANALDGKDATGWASIPTEASSWIAVNLGSSREIGHVVLSWGISSAKDYRLEASFDGKAWTEIARRSGMAAGIRRDDFQGLSVMARYLRVTCLSKSKGSAQYSLRELSAYALPPKATSSPSPAPFPSSAAVTPPATEPTETGFFFNIGCGMALPLGDESVALEYGVYPTISLGWGFPAGPGRLRLGFESGALLESTKESDSYFQYSAIAIPAGLLVAYDLRLFDRLALSLEAAAGYSATLVNYDSEDLADRGVLKPYTDGAADLCFNLGKHLGLMVGTKFLTVFYDEHAYFGVSPELRFSFRF